MRRLRILSGHPLLGNAGELRAEFEGAQAYVDAGLAEWTVVRTATMETTSRAGAPEAATPRPTARRQATREQAPREQR
jgi:hypothetical protein